MAYLVVRQVVRRDVNGRPQPDGQITRQARPPRTSRLPGLIVRQVSELADIIVCQVSQLADIIVCQVSELAGIIVRQVSELGQVDPCRLP